MEKYLWVFPVLFIFHDFEEIIGLGIWLKKNNQIISDKYPKIATLISKIYTEYSTEGMAVAVFEEFLLCILICLIAIFSGFYLLWMGVFIAFIIHMIIHIAQSIILRNYVPALATSIIAVPISIYVLTECVQQVNCSLGTVIIWSIIGFVMIVTNLIFAHSLMRKYTRWISR